MREYGCKDANEMPDRFLDRFFHGRQVIIRDYTAVRLAVGIRGEKTVLLTARSPAQGPRPAAAAPSGRWERSSPRREDAADATVLGWAAHARVGF